MLRRLQMPDAVKANPTFSEGREEVCSRIARAACLLCARKFSLSWREMTKEHDRAVIAVIRSTTNDGRLPSGRLSLILGGRRKHERLHGASSSYPDFVFATIVALCDGHIACHPHSSRTPHVRPSKCVVHALGHSVVSAGIDSWSPLRPVASPRIVVEP